MGWGPLPWLGLDHTWPSLPPAGSTAQEGPLLYPLPPQSRPQHGRPGVSTPAPYLVPGPSDHMAVCKAGGKRSDPPQAVAEGVPIRGC